MSRPQPRGDWVDRGEPAAPTLVRLLGHCFDRHAPEDAGWGDAHATAILGMVDAGLGEHRIASYLRALARELGLGAGEPPGARVFAAALWHAAKVALVRDAAQRATAEPGGYTTEPLAAWLTQRLLTPEEAAASRARRTRADGPG